MNLKLNKLLSFFLILFISISFFFIPAVVQARSYRTKSSDVYVKGYYRKNGTYVQPHYRSAPDSSVLNNYSCIDDGKCGYSSGTGSDTSYGSYNLNNDREITCPANSTKLYGYCTCNDDYEKNYSTGSCDKCPLNSTGKYGFCTCDSGYSKNYSTNKCEKIVCPEHSQLKYGYYCACDAGYEMNYSTNKCDRCPSNSHYSYGYCICDNGYTRNYTKNKCLKSN